MAFGPSPGRIGRNPSFFGCAARPPGHVKISNCWIVCGVFFLIRHDMQGTPPVTNHLIRHFSESKKRFRVSCSKILIPVTSLQEIESHEFELLRSCLAIHCMKKYLQAGRLIFCETFVMQSSPSWLSLGWISVFHISLVKGRDVQPSCEAASSSRAIGSHFPVWSRGILPQISGFLFIGFLLAAKFPGAEVAWWFSD